MLKKSKVVILGILSLVLVACGSNNSINNTMTKDLDVEQELGKEQEADLNQISEPESQYEIADYTSRVTLYQDRDEYFGLNAEIEDVVQRTDDYYIISVHVEDYEVIPERELLGLNYGDTFFSNAGHEFIYYGDCIEDGKIYVMQKKYLEEEGHYFLEDLEPGEPVIDWWIEKHGTDENGEDEYWVVREDDDRDSFFREDVEYWLVTKDVIAKVFTASSDYGSINYTQLNMCDWLDGDCDDEFDADVISINHRSGRFHFDGRGYVSEYSERWHP